MASGNGQLVLLMSSRFAVPVIHPPFEYFRQFRSAKPTNLLFWHASRVTGAKLTEAREVA